MVGILWSYLTHLHLTRQFNITHLQLCTQTFLTSTQDPTWNHHESKLVQLNMVLLVVHVRQCHEPQHCRGYTKREPGSTMPTADVGDFFVCCWWFCRNTVSIIVFMVTERRKDSRKSSLLHNEWRQIDTWDRDTKKICLIGLLIAAGISMSIFCAPMQLPKCL